MSIPKRRPANSKAAAGLRPGHYFDTEPAVAPRLRSFRLRLGSLELELQADRGVFGSKGVDAGTLVLLREAPAPPPAGEILDLGSGYGPIALTVARRSPGARVWAVDVNERALELTRLNAAAAQASNVVVGTPDEVPADLRFDAIYSNPPVRVGKAPLHDMLVTWLPRLQAGAPAYLVVQRNLGSDSLARWLEGQGFRVERLKSKKGYRILEVKTAATGS
jgi:16S rRNA G1207 methylase RsmC